MSNNSKIWIAMLAFLAGFIFGWTAALHQIEHDKRNINIEWPGGSYHGEYYPDRNR
jgi:hypothetical protein